jgi:hypothetical protein
MHWTPQVFVALACPLTTIYAQGNLPTQSGASGSDIAQITAVSPDSGLVLREGQKVTFELAIHYSLQSYETAILQVYAERYADSGGKCDNTALHQTEGGTTVRLKRGEGNVKAHFHWQEGTGPDAKVPRSAASLAFGMNLWTDRRGHPVKPMIRAFEKSFCRAVQP